MYFRIGDSTDVVFCLQVRAPEGGCVLVVASDGVWNVVSEDDCARIIRDVSHHDVKSAA